MTASVWPPIEPRASWSGRGTFLQSLLYAPDRGSGEATSERPARVLVVEDDFLLAMVIEHALLDAGFVVVGIAVSADEALAMARSMRPDLALMDIRLAGVRDGVDAALDIFSQTGIRCIFATAHTDPSTRHKAQPARPLGWLSKPYTPDALVDAVRDALAGLPKP